MKAPMLTIAVCAVLALAGCGDDDSTTETTGSGDTTAQQPAEDTSTKPTVEVPAGSPPKKLVEKDLVEGDGATAKAGDEVSVHYVGVGYESGEEFETSWGRAPFTFQLGSSAVIPGWEQGIVGMKVGGRRELTIPPDLAYGEEGSPPDIGPNETLIFAVDLLEVG